jgi:hypothetical protein
MAIGTKIFILKKRVNKRFYQTGPGKLLTMGGIFSKP